LNSLLCASQLASVRAQEICRIFEV
jgi:hypothetical protein